MINLTKTLAAQQLITAKKRTFWTVLGVALSVAMLTAVNGFVASALAYLAAENRTIHFSERLGFLLIGLVLGAVIVAASIIVISNAFRVSAGERTRQFGILKSVGATKEQIRSIIMYEAVYVSLMGIPVGVAVGLAIQFTVLRIIDHFLSDIAHTTNFSFPFTISAWALLGAVAGAFAVVLISALLPAMKAARHPAVSALFHADDIKVKKLRTLGLSRLLFGAEGHLAAKQMKRSRRNYRATVLSLTISVILLLATASLRTNLLRDISIRFGDQLDANVGVSAWNSHGIPHETSQAVTAHFRNFPDTQVRGFGFALVEMEVDGERVDVRLIEVAPELYSRIANQAGVAHGHNILINVKTDTDILGITRQTHPFGHLVQHPLLYFYRYHTQTLDDAHLTIVTERVRENITIHGQIRSIPEDLLYESQYVPSIIMPTVQADEFFWLVCTDYPDEFIAFVWDIRRDYLQEGGSSRFFARDFGLAAAEARALTNILSLLIYGFTAMLTLIALTNVISTISTNTKIRAREFAVLTSIGMTQGGINRMLALESLISSVRSLLFGLPLGAVAAWLVYLGTQMDRMRFGFIFPWQVTLLCVAGVFVVTFVTTLFAAARRRKGSIVETIRAVI